MSRQSVVNLAAGCVLLLGAGSLGARAQPVDGSNLELVHQQIEALKARAAELEAEIADLKAALDQQTKQMVELTDKLNETVSQMQAMRVERDELAAELAQAKEVLRTHGIAFPPDPKDSANARRLEGRVTKAGMQGGLVEISLGQDAGVRVRDVFEVFRVTNGRAQFAGTITVLKTERDGSVCQILPGRGVIQEGDLVVRASQPEKRRQEKQPPLGMVAKVLEDGRLEIAVDDLDGLRVGQKYDVFRIVRGSIRYIGRVSVVEVTVGAVICTSDPRYRRDDIQEADQLVPREFYTSKP